MPLRWLKAVFWERRIASRPRGLVAGITIYLAYGASAPERRSDLVYRRDGGKMTADLNRQLVAMADFVQA